jgi:hypothetical protein
MINDALPSQAPKVPRPTPEQRVLINWLINEEKAKDRSKRAAMLSMRKVELARREMECVQPEVPSLRGADMQEHALAKNHRTGEGRTDQGEHIGLGEVWSAGIRAAAISEGITAV